MDAIVSNKEFLPNIFSTLSNITTQSKLISHNLETLRKTEKEYISKSKKFNDYLDKIREELVSLIPNQAQQSLFVINTLKKAMKDTIENGNKSLGINKDIIKMMEISYKKLTVISQMLEAILENIEVDENSKDYGLFFDKFIEKSKSSSFSSAYK
ncbi:MAG: hypothetical protein WAT71_02725 [Ignavibacteria bacterium]